MQILFMKINILSILSSRLYSRLLPAMILSLGGLVTLSACQKDPEPQTTEAQAKPSSAPVATSVVGGDQTAEVAVVEDSSVEAEREADLADLANNSGAEGATPNAETTEPSPEQAIKGTQITDVQYRSATGDTISVVFETSATGVLNAIVTLPNKPKMILSAPEGQGNNPTYRSKDGSTELVSHGGGSTIDLMHNNKVTNFEAISAEAEVVTQP